MKRGLPEEGGNSLSEREMGRTRSLRDDSERERRRDSGMGSVVARCPSTRISSLCPVREEEAEEEEEEEDLLGTSSFMSSGDLRRYSIRESPSETTGNVHDGDRDSASMEAGRTS